MEAKVVPLNRMGCAHALYCFPDILGDAHAFDDVAGALDGRISVASLEFEFEAALIEDRLPDSMQQLAHICRQALLASIGGAPASFYGNAFGGIVALHVAQDLKRCGRGVDHVFLGGTVSPDIFRDHAPWVEFMKMLADPVVAGTLEVQHASLSPERQFGLDIVAYLCELEERLLGRPCSEQRIRELGTRRLSFESYLDRLSRHKLSAYPGRLTYIECVGDPADYRNYVRSVARDGYESRALRFTSRTQHLRLPGARYTSEIIVNVLGQRRDPPNRSSIGAKHAEYAVMHEALR